MPRNPSSSIPNEVPATNYLNLFEVESMIAISLKNQVHDNFLPNSTFSVKTAQIGAQINTYSLLVI